MDSPPQLRPMNPPHPDPALLDGPPDFFGLVPTTTPPPPHHTRTTTDGSVVLVSVSDSSPQAEEDDSDAILNNNNNGAAVCQDDAADTNGDVVGRIGGPGIDRSSTATNHRHHNDPSSHHSHHHHNQPPSQGVPSKGGCSSSGGISSSSWREVLLHKVLPTGTFRSPHSILVSLTAVFIVIIIFILWAESNNGAGIGKVQTRGGNSSTSEDTIQSIKDASSGSSGTNNPSSSSVAPSSTSTNSAPTTAPPTASKGASSSTRNVIEVTPSQRPYGSTKYTDAQLISSMKPLSNMSAFPAFHKLFNNLAIKPQYILPTLPWVQLSNDEQVSDRGVGVGDVYKCFGSSGGDTPTEGNNNGGGEESSTSSLDDVPTKFDFVFFPIGCQGEPRGKPCEFTTSCKLGSTFPKFLPCAKRRFGAILGDNFYPSGLTRKDRLTRLDAELNDKFIAHHADMKGLPIPAGSYLLAPNITSKKIVTTTSNNIENDDNDDEGGSEEVGKKRKVVKKGEEEDPMATYGMKYYATVGNHDNPKPHYQIRSDHDSWVMPAFHHVSPLLYTPSTTTTTSSSSSKDTTTTTTTSSLPSTKPKSKPKSRMTSVQLFLIDTHWGYGKNDPHMAEEARWLDDQLSRSSADWKIVGTHEPIHGFLGFDHGKGLMRHVHPVLLKHNVRIFVCAHAHSVHMFKVPKKLSSSTKNGGAAESGYYTVVSAGFADNVHALAKPRRPPGYYHLGTGGVAILINKDEAHVVAFSRDEKVIFAHRIQRRGNAAGIVAQIPPPPSSSPSSKTGGTESPPSSSTLSLPSLPLDVVDTVPSKDPMWGERDFCEAMKPFVPVNCQ